MPIILDYETHPATTQRRGLSYQFTPKHHGGQGHQGQAQWLPSLTREEEFSVFDSANEHDLADEDGRLYGLLRTAEDEVQFLGTRDEQVAEFPVARTGEAWHGYPVYPLANPEAPRRGGEAGKPPKAVFLKMESAGLLSQQQRKRLMKGKYA
jgi:hypothetical protein